MGFVDDIIEMIEQHVAENVVEYRLNDRDDMEYICDYVSKELDDLMEDISGNISEDRISGLVDEMTEDWI